MYETTATVMVTTSKLDAILGRTRLSMDAYGQLANSEPVLDALRITLRGKGVSLSESTLRSTLYLSRDSARPSLPWLALSAASPNPEHAQLIANAWAAEVVGAASSLIPGDEAQQVLDAHSEALAALLKAKAALRSVQDKHLRVNAEAEIANNHSQKMAALQAKQDRAVALENAIADNKASLEDVQARIAQLERETKTVGQPGTVASLVEQVARERSVQSGLRARQAAFEEQLQDTLAAVGKLHKETTEMKLAIERTEAQQSRELEPLYSAVGDAQRRFERFDESYAAAARPQGMPAADLKLRNTAPLPREPQPRPYRYAILAIPFALLASLACVFVIAIVRESHTRRLTEQTA